MRIPVPNVFRIRVAAALTLGGETESTDQRPPARALALLWRRSAKDIRRPKDLRGSGDAYLDQRLLDDIGVAWWEVHVNAPKRPWR